MFETGFITEAQHEEALAQELSYRKQPEDAVHAEYAAETARQLVYTQYGEEAYTRGLNVHLTLNAADQVVAYRALRKGLLDYEDPRALGTGLWASSAMGWLPNLDHLVVRIEAARGSEGVRLWVATGSRF